ncbi:MAG: hypothetical protein EOO38_25995 [Cytophagaceae bacterium]|nr:MAG: hypothetical protein EOO38_25995 [Cytophagaceae bacterium]
MPGGPSDGGGGGGGGSTTPIPPGTYDSCNGKAQPVGSVSFERGTRLMVAAPSECDPSTENPTIETYNPDYIDVHINYPLDYFDTEDSYDALTLELIQAGVNNTNPIPETYYKSGNRIDMAGATPLNGRKTALDSLKSQILLERNVEIKA